MLRHVLTEAIRMLPSQSVPAKYSKREAGKLAGLAATKVEDLLGTATDSSNNDTGLLEGKFVWKLRCDPPFTLAGILFTLVRKDGYHLEQPSYAKQLPLLPGSCGSCFEYDGCSK